MQILQKLGALRKKKTPRTIQDVEFNFYPVRVARIITGDLKEIISPISDAIQVLLRPRNQDEEVLEEVSPDGSIARCRKPVSTELAKFLSDKKAATMSAAMEQLFSDKTRISLGRLIMDSLRDDCPKDPSEKEVKDFVDNENMDTVVFAEFVKGFMAANTAVFGDLGNLIQERIKSSMAKMGQDEEDQNQDDDAPELQQQETEASELRLLQEEEGELPTT